MNTKIKLDIINQKFGRLTAIKPTEKRNNSGAIWLWECECGNILEKGRNAVLNGHTKSCGCLKLEVNRKTCQNRYKGGKYINGFEFGGIRCNAKKRNILFDITIEDIDCQLEKQNNKCFYTGINLYFNLKDSVGNFILSSGNASVDRIDSNVGYIKSNVQIVLKDINLMKQQLSNEQFLYYISLIAKYKGLNE